MFLEGLPAVRWAGLTVYERFIRRLFYPPSLWRNGGLASLAP
jgi:hypothetical protein